MHTCWGKTEHLKKIKSSYGDGTMRCSPKKKKKKKFEIFVENQPIECSLRKKGSWKYRTCSTDVSKKMHNNYFSFI